MKWRGVEVEFKRCFAILPHSCKDCHSRFWLEEGFRRVWHWAFDPLRSVTEWLCMGCFLDRVVEENPPPPPGGGDWENIDRIRNRQIQEEGL